MFTNNLTSLRKKSHLTQAVLADKLGIAQSTLASYECGLREPNFEMLHTIAEFFGVSVSDLLSDGSSLSSTVSSLSDDEIILVDLFRRFPASDHSLILDLFRAALNTRG